MIALCSDLKKSRVFEKISAEFTIFIPASLCSLKEDNYIFAEINIFS